MKTIKYALLFLLVILTVGISGDIIIDSYMPDKILVKIGNIEAYPDLKVMGFGTYTTFSEENKVDMADANASVDIRQVFPVAFYVVKKTYFDKAGNKIDWKKDNNVIRTSVPLNPNSFKSRYSDVGAVEIVYNIAGFDKNKMVLYPTSMIVKYKGDSKPDDVTVFENNENFSKLKKTF